MSDDAQLALALDQAPELALPDRLYRLGLPVETFVTLTRNRVLVVSWDADTGLRLHTGYAWAPDDVLAAIIRYLAPRVPRSERLVARRKFLSFPLDRYVKSRARRPLRDVVERDVPMVQQLDRLHQILNARHFAGALGTIPIRVSDRMETRLGEFRADHDNRPVVITISRRHIRRDGWEVATETLLHEMVHQWQCEAGLPVDHGRAFRQKAREVGIPPVARVPEGYIVAPERPGTIA